MTDQTPELAERAARVRLLNEEIDELEAQVSARKSERYRIVTMDIPRILGDLMMTESSLEDGTKITVKSEVEGGFPKDDAKAARALAWLRQNGHGDLIRNTVTASFSPGQDDVAKKAREQLSALGVTLEVREAVNHQTFVSWARKRLAEGDIIDLDTLGLKPVTIAKLKFKKGDEADGQ